MRSLRVCRIVLFYTVSLIFTNVLSGQTQTPIAVSNEYGWFYIGEDGGILSTEIYQKAGDFVFNDYAIVQSNNLYGAVNKSLQLVIPINYDSLFLTSLGDFIGKKKGLYYLIDQNDEPLLNKGFTKISIYRTNYRVYNKQSVGIYLKHSGQFIPPEYENISLFGKELLITKQNDKYGLINEYNITILEPEYEYIKWFNDSLIQYRQNGLWKLLTGKYSPYKCPPFKSARMINDYWMVTYGIEKSTLLTYPAGVKVSTGVYDDFITASKKYISVIRSDKVGAIDQKSKLIIDTLYQEVHPFNDDLFIVKSNNRYGLINKENDTIIPFDYREISPYLNQAYKNFSTQDGKYLERLLFVRKKSGAGIITTKGNVVVPLEFKEVYPINETFYVGKNNNAHYLYNSKGESLSNLPFRSLKYKEGLIMARSGYCFSLFNQDSLIGSPYNDRVIIAGKVAKLYREGDLEVITFADQWQIYDRFTYENIPSYKVLGLPALKITENEAKEKTSYEMFFSNHLNKWGIRNKYSKRVQVKPCYDNVYETAYGSVYKTEIRSPTTEFSIGKLKFTTNILYGYVSLNQTIDSIPAENVWIDFPPKNFMLGSSTIVNPMLHKNGKFNFAHHEENFKHHGVYSYIDERFNNCLRYNEGGKIELNESDDSHYLVSLNDFMSRINPDHKIKAADSTTIAYLMNDTGNLFISGGAWKYKQYMACEFNGESTSRTECNKPLEKLPASDYVENGDKNCFKVQRNKTGVLNNTSHEIIPSRYVSIRKEPKTLSYKVVSDMPQYGYLQDNHVIIDQHYQKALPFSEGLAAIFDGQYWGYIDEKEDTIIIPNYEEVSSFKGGLALVKKEGKYGFINRKGDWVIANNYSSASPFKDGLSRVKEKSKWAYINKNGEKVNQFELKKAGQFKNGYAIVKSKKGESIINLLGEEQGAKAFKKIKSYNSQVFIIRKSKKYVVFNLETGKRVSKYYDRIGAYSDGFVWFKGKEGYGYLGVDGKVKIKGKYKKVANFNEGRAAFKEKREWGYMNEKGEKVVRPIYNSVTPFSDGVAFVDNDSNTFAINKNGNILFKLNGKKVKEPFNDGLAILSEHGKEFFINKNGVNPFRKEFDEAGLFQFGLAKVRIGSKTGVLNMQGDYEHYPKYNDIEVSGGKLLLFSEGNYEGMYLGDVDYPTREARKIIDTKYQKVDLIAPSTYRLTNETYQKVFHDTLGVIWDSRRD